MRTFMALLIGGLFGFGLALSGMIDPAKVTNFLDLAGHWDPTLAFVMGGALLVTTPTYYFAKRLSRPILDACFYIPSQNAIDKPLIVGSAVFGIGWGVGGFCPGPALAALSSLHWLPVIFVAAMIVGQWLADRVKF